MPDEGDGIRLQKVLARAGLGSRRACEELIDRGRVRVNGEEAAARDGVAITGEGKVTVQADEDSELVLVDAR